MGKQHSLEISDDLGGDVLTWESPRCTGLFLSTCIADNARLTMSSEPNQSDTEQDDWSEESHNILDTPYGKKVDLVMTSRQLTVNQVRALQPMVDDYVVRQGKERTEYVEKVCCAEHPVYNSSFMSWYQAFREVWDGPPIVWEDQANVTLNSTTPRFRYLRKVCTQTSLRQPCLRGTMLCIGGT